MVESIGLFYFSGTGNTQVVTELLTAAFERRGAQVETERIEHVLQGKARFEPEAHDLVGIGHPIHGFDAPRIVYDFVDALPPVENKRTFIFKSAGDFISVNNGASKTAIKRLRHKGYDVFYDRIVCMPTNWAMQYDDVFSKQLCYVAVAKTEHMAGEILAGRERELKINLLLRWIMRLISRGEDRGARRFGENLTVTDACTDCDTCVDNCPTANIQRDDGRITFGNACVWCMRCIYACPQQAIVPRLAKFSVLKDGYDIRSIVNNPDLEGDFVTDETRGFFRHFLEYVRNVSV
jgi:ferredoxin/flavodoxin